MLHKHQSQSNLYETCCVQNYLCPTQSEGCLHNIPQVLVIERGGKKTTTATTIKLLGEAVTTPLLLGEAGSPWPSEKIVKVESEAGAL